MSGKGIIFGGLVEDGSDFGNFRLETLNVGDYGRE